MNISEGIIVVLISQLPLAIYTIWNGVRRNKPEIKKLRADEQSALSDAVEGAGKTLIDAWKHIHELEVWKAEATTKINQLEDELRKWRNYAARLIKQIKEIDPKADPVPFETDPKIKK